MYLFVRLLYRNRIMIVNRTWPRRYIRRNQKTPSKYSFALIYNILIIRNMTKVRHLWTYTTQFRCIQWLYELSKLKFNVSEHHVDIGTLHVPNIMTKYIAPILN